MIFSVNVYIYSNCMDSQGILEAIGQQTASAYKINRPIPHLRRCHGDPLIGSFSFKIIPALSLLFVRTCKCNFVRLFYASLILHIFVRNFPVLKFPAIDANLSVLHFQFTGFFVRRVRVLQTQLKRSFELSIETTQLLICLIL